jgi:hypothetical protein
MRSAVSACRAIALLWFIACASVSIQVLRACVWTYPIWGIRSETADPLFRFVRKGRAGYIDSSGKTIVQPNLPASDNFFGEFHEGLLAVKEDHGYRYVDHDGAVVFRTDSHLAFDFSEGLVFCF